MKYLYFLKSSGDDFIGGTDLKVTKQAEDLEKISKFIEYGKPKKFD